MKKIFLICSLFFVCASIQSQVLISLLFGEKLNKPGLEFGLEGGFNWSDLDGLENDKMLRAFNLGFYFDIRLKNSMFLYTGVLVKSRMGADKLSDNDLVFLQLDKYEEQGEYSQMLNYFILPVFAKYKFRNFIYIEGGPQVAWLHDSWIEFNYDDKDHRARIRHYNKDRMNRIDVGISGGLGYTLMKGTGVTLGVKYYYGFSDVIKDKSGSNNQSLFIKMNIPIGTAKKES